MRKIQIQKTLKNHFVFGLISLVTVTTGCIVEPAENAGPLLPAEDTKVTTPTPGACASLNTKTLDFGETSVAQTATKTFAIAPCDNPLNPTPFITPLEITDVWLSADTDSGFQLDPSEMRKQMGELIVPVDTMPSIENPVILSAQEVLHIVVFFAPNTTLPDSFQGTVRIETNDPDHPIFEVSLSGTSKKAMDEPTCDNPTALGAIQEGAQVTPQTKLHLLGEPCSGTNGAISAWKWSVIQPSGSQSTFLPSDNFPNPTFEANVAGEYTFLLDVWNLEGKKSQLPWKMSVMVLPVETMHIELLWHTPNDPDETDEGPEAGADMDLHFALQGSAAGPDLDGDGQPDPWFDQPFDVFWFNAHPNWGDLNPVIPDDPGLDLDDTDGAGPENLNLHTPEIGATYHVGVHYWNDHGYGESLATVRIYLFANLVAEFADVALSNHDLWDVATIHWGENGVDIIPSWDDPANPAITPDYQSVFFLQP